MSQNPNQIQENSAVYNEFVDYWLKQNGAVEIEQVEQSQQPSSREGTDTSTEQATPESRPGKPASPEQQVLLDLEALKEYAAQTREAYAAELAKDYGRMLGRFLQNDSGVARLAKKAPGIQRAADFVNRVNIFDKRQLDDNGDSIAQQKYRAASEQLIAIQQRGRIIEMEAQVEAGEITNEKLLANIRAERLILLTEEDGMLEQAIAEQRQSQSKEASWLSNWWVRQEGFLGNVKKAAVAVGTGVVTGATVTGGAMLFGLAVPTVGLAAAGGVVGGIMARHINQRRANSFIDKDKKITVAKSEALQNSSITKDDILALGSDISTTSFDQGMATIINNAEGNAAEAMKNNRRRMKTLVGLGALGAKLGGVMIDNAVDLLNGDKVSATESGGGADTTDNINEGTPDTSQEVPDAPQETPTVESPSTPEVTINGNEFMVEPGNGLTQELQQFAEINGRSLTPEQAWQLHNDLINQYGGSYINGGTYWEAGDLRISSPGMTSFKEGAAEFAIEWMKQRGI